MKKLVQSIFCICMLYCLLCGCGMGTVSNSDNSDNSGRSVNSDKQISVSASPATVDKNSESVLTMEKSSVLETEEIPKPISASSQEFSSEASLSKPEIVSSQEPFSESAAAPFEASSPSEPVIVSSQEPLPAPAASKPVVLSPKSSSPDADVFSSESSSNPVMSPAQKSVPDSTNISVPQNKGSHGGSNFETYDNKAQQDTEDTYVLNTSSHKFHYPSCRSVPKIAPQNYSTSSLSRAELIANGYKPCGICKP